jgi:hypothetical protein
VRKRKIPRAALADLAMTCEFFSNVTGEPAGENLKRYLALMDKYDYYFFNEPWPENYDYKKATAFTETDQAFLSANKEEFDDRYETVLIKKNLYLNGFMGPIGMMWTQQAYEEQHNMQNLKLRENAST